MADRVLPIVRLFFACDSAIIDLSDEKWLLKNPWHTLAMPPGVKEKFVQMVIWLYAQVTDAVGEFNLRIQLQTKDGFVLGASDVQPVVFPGTDRLAVFERVFKMTDVPFPRPDVYEFRLIANYAELEGGKFELRVLEGDDV